MCLQTVTQFLLITKVQGFLTFFFVSGRCFFFFFVSKPTAYSPSHAPLYTNRYIYQGVHNIVVVDVMSLRVLSPFNDSLNFILL